MSVIRMVILLVIAIWCINFGTTKITLTPEDKVRLAEDTIAAAVALWMMIVTQIGALALGSYIIIRIAMAL